MSPLSEALADEDFNETIAEIIKKADIATGDFREPITNVPQPESTCDDPEYGPDPSLKKQGENQKIFQEGVEKLLGSKSFEESEPYKVLFRDGSGVKSINFSEFASFSPKQLDFLTNSDPSDCKYAMLDGSVRSGKTRITLWKWFFICADPPDGLDLMMCAKTMGNIYDNVIKDMKDPKVFGPWAHLVIAKKGAPQIQIVDANVLIKAHGQAGDDEKIRGLTLGGIYMDEATLSHETFFVEARARIAFTWSAQMIMTTNPGAPTHWLKVKYLDKMKKGDRMKRWTFRLKDNPGLTRATMRDLMAAIPPGPEYERKINGQWAGAEGLVYSIWDEAKHIVKWEDIPPMKFIWITIDYGVTHATSAIVQGLGVDGIIYDINEYRYDVEDGLMPMHEAMLVDEIVAWTKRDGFLPPQIDQNMKPRYWIVDSAARGVKNRLLLVHKIRNVAKRTNKYVDSGLQTCIGLLHEGNSMVSERCLGVIKEMTSHFWDKAASLASGRDIVKKENDDSLDARRYGIMTTFPLTYKHLKHKTMYLPEKQVSARELETM